MYKQYRRKVESLRKGVIAESMSRKEDAQAMAADEAKAGQAGSSTKRKSRWGDKSDKVVLAQPALSTASPSILPGMASGPLTSVRRNNPQLVQYAIRVFGTTDLEESQWKQCEDQIKVIISQILLKTFIIS